MKFLFAVLCCFFLYAEEKLSIKANLPEQDHVIVLNFESAIHHGLANFLDKVLAKTNKFTKAIILELNTPGGDLQATNRIVSRFFETDFPVIIHVVPNTGSATSAGVFLITGAHLSYMSPGSTLGSAHPVSGNGEDIQSDMRKKVENYAVSNITSLAKQRNRNQEWVKKAVLESASLTAEEALKINVIDGIAKNQDELFSALKSKTISIKDKKIMIEDLSKFKILRIEPDYLDKVISFLADPTMISFLSMIAILGISIEFYHPGLILPGLVGAICMILTFLTMNLISVNTSGIIFLVIGGGLILTEAFIVSGLLGAIGTLSLCLGFFFLFDTDMFWGIQPNYYLIYLILGIFVALFAILIREVLRSFRFSGKDLLIGKTAFVVKDIAPEGKIELNGVYWLANSEKEIKSGCRVKILSRTGLRLTVEEV